MIASAILLLAIAAPSKGTEGRATSSPVILLTRTPCYGRCPSYRVELFSSGEIRFFGDLHTRAPLDRKKTISPDLVRQLLREIDEAGFWGWDNQYQFSVSDADTAIVEVRRGRKTKKIFHYAPGFEGDPAPKALLSIEEKIDRLAGTEEWVVPESERIEPYQDRDRKYTPAEIEEFKEALKRRRPTH